MSTPQQPEGTEPDVLDTESTEVPGTTDASRPFAPTEESRHRSGLDSQGRVKRTRAATAWASAVALALVTILFVVFVVQNSRSITISYLWMDGRISEAAALLIAAVAGALLVGIPAAVRIGQLRHSLKRTG